MSCLPGFSLGTERNPSKEGGRRQEDVGRRDEARDRERLEGAEAERSRYSPVCPLLGLGRPPPHRAAASPSWAKAAQSATSILG